MKLLHVAGARPNFPKLAPVHRAAAARGLEQIIVHTGQHYDDALSASFLRELEIPEPDVNLGVGSGSHAQQTARVMTGLEPVMVEAAPDWVVVYGDVNSTLAAAVVASKLGIRLAHVEAGLRSHDRSMPEEINRLVTDRLANLLLTPSRDAGEELRREGEPDDEIVFVGNVMIDSLMAARDKAMREDVGARVGMNSQTVVVTLHRPSNVDDGPRLHRIARALSEIARERPVLFPAHPRTRARLQSFSVDMPGVQIIEPLRYLEMVAVTHQAYAVVTDSGGVQEESTALGVPCFTIRPNTERPVTVTEGTNTLVPDPDDLPGHVRRATRPDTPRRPEGWDGRAAERVVEALVHRG